ncbi:MAG TPA: DUF4920 domain-containing protein, partial [Myxococcota bacterium]|nr:DUF4920 domain-containing protein [Myxococcota bacterium]
PEAGASSASASAPAGDWTTYGGAWSDAQVVPVQTVLDDPGAYAGKALTVEGEISDVCQKRGCWMVVSDGKRTMRVTMKDHAFGVDMASTGARAQVQGELVAKAVDPKTVEHYKSEAARPEVIPETAAGDGPSYELVASTVRIRR